MIRVCQAEDVYSFSLKEEILSEDEDAVFTQVDKKDSIQVDLDLPYLDKVRQATSKRTKH